MVKTLKPTPRVLTKTDNTVKKKVANKVGKVKLKKSLNKDTTGSKKQKKLLQTNIEELGKLVAKPNLKEKKDKSVEHVAATLPKEKVKKKNVKPVEEQPPSVKAPPPDDTTSGPNARTNKTKKSKVKLSSVPDLETPELKPKAKTSKKTTIPTSNSSGPTRPTEKSGIASKSDESGSSSTAPKSEKTTKKSQKKKKAIYALKKKKHYFKKNKTKKSPKIPPKRLFEAVPFDEDKFNEIVNLENIVKVCKALKEIVEKEVANKRTIFKDYRYILNIASFKIPCCPKRMVKLNLKHSLVDKDDSVVIIVADLKRGAKKDYEPTIRHYEDLFRKAGIEGLTVMPFNQLRKEYNTYESRRKFGNTYDYFMCDGRIVGHASALCGKILQKPRTTFHGVHMSKPDLKKEIEKSLRRTAYKQFQKGDLISIPVGNDKFSAEQLAENVEYVVTQLRSIFPGGLANVRSMYLKIGITGTSSIPVYINMGQAPTETPNVIGPREKRMLKLKAEANEVLTKFALTKNSEFIRLSKGQVKRKLQFRENKATLLKENSVEKPIEDDDGDDDGVVVKKKARKEEVSKELPKKVKKTKLDSKVSSNKEGHLNSNELERGDEATDESEDYNDEVIGSDDGDDTEEDEDGEEEEEDE